MMRRTRTSRSSSTRAATVTWLQAVATVVLLLPGARGGHRPPAPATEVQATRAAALAAAPDERTPSAPRATSAPDPGPHAGPVAGVRYEPPVEAPVVDPFRPPANPYGPGNRGIEYATVVGTEVGAAADGVVTFAGFVAGSLFVTVLHADGVRTTASYLASIRVVAGLRVNRGEVIGIAAARLHISARVGGEYIDPASLWGSGSSHVFLVPLAGGAPTGGQRRPRPPEGWTRAVRYARQPARQSVGCCTSTLARIHPRSPTAPGPGSSNRREGSVA